MWADPMLPGGRPEHESNFVDDKTPLTQTVKVCYMNIWKQLMDPETDASIEQDSEHLHALADINEQSTHSAKDPKCNLS